MSKHSSKTFIGEPTGGFAELSEFFRPHSNPATDKPWADNDTEPGVKDAVMHIDEDPHSG
jgi:hypothetical protein